MKEKFLNGLEKVLAALLLLFILTIMDVECGELLPQYDFMFSKLLLGIWTIGIVGLGTYILTNGICAGVDAIFQSNLPDWYIAPKFKRRLRILCFFVSLVAFIGVLAIYAAMLEEPLLAAIGIISAQITNTIAGELGHIMSRIGYITGIVRSAVWGGVV